jgi:hypothetical protein
MRPSLSEFKQLRRRAVERVEVGLSAEATPL